MELAGQKHDQPYPLDEGRIVVASHLGRVPIDVGRVVRIALAIVLVVAALLKAYEVASNAGFRDAASGPMRLKLALAAFELLFAVWLLSNVRPIWGHRAAICLVGVLAAASLYRLLAGERDCGCFGTFIVHPAWTLALDIFLLLALWRWEPEHSTASAIENSPEPDGSQGALPKGLRRSLKVTGFLAAPLLAAGAVVTAVRMEPSLLPLILMRPALLAINPTPKLLTEARQGETVMAHFEVRNVSKQPVKLLGAKSSCGCTVVTSDFPVELDPGSAATIKVRMTVGVPNSDGRFVKEARLFVNRSGTVPPLIIVATVLQ